MVANLSIQKDYVNTFVPLVDIVEMDIITKVVRTAVFVNQVNPYKQLEV